MMVVRKLLVIFVSMVSFGLMIVWICGFWVVFLVVIFLGSLGGKLFVFFLICLSMCL